MKPKTEINIKEGRLYLTVSYPPTELDTTIYTFFNSDATRIAVKTGENIVATIQGGTLKSNHAEPRQHTWIYKLKDEPAAIPQEKTTKKTTKKTKKKTTNKTKKKGD